MVEPSGNAFDIARETLRLVGEFKTPPTPDVYEVWFRYVQGNDSELRSALQHVIESSGAVTVELLRSLHEQFCCAAMDDEAEISQSLAVEISQVQSLVASQQQANVEFEGSLHGANEKLVNLVTKNANQATCLVDLSESTLAMRRQLNETLEKLSESEQKVAALQETLAYSQRGLMTDHLTGIGNRRYFDTLVKQVLRDRAVPGESNYLALFDLDNFKQVNDVFGHQAGDQLLQYIATEITALHPSISLARLGGDEFAALIRVKDRDEVVQFADDLRSYFATRQLCDTQTQEVIGVVKFSIGLAKLRSADDHRSWYERADQFLYRAKQLGRNRAVVEPL
ncbi:MAG: GGDEF domain-containing protein [Pirellulaceae bacterium]